MSKSFQKGLIILEFVFSILHFIPALCFFAFGFFMNLIFFIFGAGYSKMGDSSMFIDIIKYTSIFSLIPIIIVFVLFVLSIISLVRFLKNKNNKRIELIVCIGFILIDALLIIFGINFSSLLLVSFSFISLIIFFVGIYGCIRSECK